MQNRRAVGCRSFIVNSAFRIPGQEPGFFPNPCRAEMEMPRGLATDMPLYPLG
jgi:hypothetical protein